MTNRQKIAMLNEDIDRHNELIARHVARVKNLEAMRDHLVREEEGHDALPGL